MTGEWGFGVAAIWRATDRNRLFTSPHAYELQLYRQPDPEPATTTAATVVVGMDVSCEMVPTEGSLANPPISHQAVEPLYPRVALHHDSCDTVYSDDFNTVIFCPSQSNSQAVQKKLV